MNIMNKRYYQLKPLIEFYFKNKYVLDNCHMVFRDIVKFRSVMGFQLSLHVPSIDNEIGLDIYLSDSGNYVTQYSVVENNRAVMQLNDGKVHPKVLSSADDDNKLVNYPHSEEEHFHISIMDEMLEYEVYSSTLDITYDFMKMYKMHTELSGEVYQDNYLDNCNVHISVVCYNRDEFCDTEIDNYVQHVITVLDGIINEYDK